jgi:protein TonB
MVRAIPVNQWWRADFLERIRPGFALSAALHVGLLTALAYYLAFQPVAPIQPEDPLTTIVIRDFPPTTKPAPQTKFTPTETPKLDKVIPDVKPLPIPPRDVFDRAPSTATTTIDPPAPKVIIDPKPVYRGGLVFPERAADAGKSGYVIFSFIIKADGSVGNSQVIEEVPDGYGFATAAKKAFPKWRFEPRLVDGKAVAAPAQIKVVFNLN